MTNTKTRQLQKAEVIADALADALLDTREERDRYYEAKLQTAGRHMDERARRMRFEAEVSELRKTLGRVRVRLQYAHNEVHRPDATQEEVQAAFADLWALLDQLAST